MLQKEIVIKPKQRWQLLDLQELWEFRELFFIFTWRDLKIRYKQTLVGVAWVIFQPLLSTGIFTIFFGKLAKIPSGDLPYELFVFIGLIFWSFFSSVLTQASNSLVDNANILKKIYFPREILVFSTAVTGMVDFSINFIVLLVIALLLGFIPSPLIFIIFPFCVFLASTTALGLGFLLASFNIKYRDVKYILPFFIQSLLFLTPVIYPTSIVRQSFRYLFALNPMAAVIEGIRSVFSKSIYLDPGTLIISTISALAIFFVGLSFFRLTERFFADTV